MEPLDRQIAHHVGLCRIYAGAARRASVASEAGRDALRETLRGRVDALLAEGNGARRRLQVDALIEDLRRLRGETYRDLASRVAAEAADVGRSEIEATARILRLDPGDAADRVPGIVSRGRTALGRTIRGEQRRLIDAEMRDMRRVLRDALMQDLDADQVLDRMLGKRGVSGVINARSRRRIEAWTRSSVAHAAESSREAVLGVNGGVLTEEVWNSILDGKTTATCQARSGKRYRAVTHEPIGHSIPWLEGPGKIHVRCRSTSLVRREGDPRVRVPTWGAWIKRQRREVQVFALGEHRTRLLRAGRLDVSQFFDRRGERLTVAELREAGF